ncbi:MAG TPA: beta-N-acetylhexosaminidase [Polyangiaceae bacterium]|jgi:beta-N-acetylhexosaminidase|nr:beta-N-acetylhexosaminidase [Polyangiaceae bacterium]
MTASATVISSCGQLVIGGFAGTTLPPAFRRALADRRRGGVILFKRNIDGEPARLAALTRDVHASAPETPLVGIDQEGGRVARLRAPWLELPPMRTVASWGDPALAQRIAHGVGVELAAMGITITFAPVLDVNTCPRNPVIGDRAFGDDPATVATFGAAWIRGLQSAGVLACGKHFPGHGDTTKDSHVDLPVVDQPRERLDAVELVPFRAAVAGGVAALMTAHVVYPALDGDRPGTLSPAIATRLRDAVGFRGVLFSDDLEMSAIAARGPVEDSAVQAVAAGCDALLICSSEELQERAVEALVREAEASPAFRGRCEEASRRLLAARRRSTARPLDDDGIARVVGGSDSAALAREIAQRVAS